MRDLGLAGRVGSSGDSADERPRNWALAFSRVAGVPQASVIASGRSRVASEADAAESLRDPRDIGGSATALADFAFERRFAASLLASREARRLTQVSPIVLVDGRTTAERHLELIAFPHLTSLRSQEASAHVVVWEAMRPESFAALLPEGGAALTYWREKVGELLEVRKARRDGSLEALYPALAGQLELALTDRYMSFLFVLQHDRLMRLVADAVVRAAPVNQRQSI